MNDNLWNLTSLSGKIVVAWLIVLAVAVLGWFTIDTMIINPEHNVLDEVYQWWRGVIR